MVTDVGGQGGTVERPFLGDQVQGAAGEERREESRLARVDGERLHHGEAGVPAQSQDGLDAAQIVEELPVLDHHPLGLARRA